MNILGIDIEQIATLSTQVATSGAMRAAELVADDVFEYIVGVAVLVYQVDLPLGL